MDASQGPHPTQYTRQHYERLLELFQRLAPRVGQLAAMQAVLEEHDRTRDAAVEGPKRATLGQRREDRRA